MNKLLEELLRSLKNDSQLTVTDYRTNGSLVSVKYQYQKENGEYEETHIALSVWDVLEYIYNNLIISE
jgi:hypothetical protein